MTVTRLARPNEAPQVVAVEGLCFAGKSTLVAHLAALVDAVVAPEYTDLAPLPPWPPRDGADVTATLRHFLHLEQQRAVAARAAGAATVLLDRSPLTLISHERGMTALDVPADPAAAIELYAAAADIGTILIPHAYLYLAVPDPVTAPRRADRGPVAAHLDGPQVRARINHACRAWLALVPPRRRLLLDGTQPPNQLAATAARFLATAGGPPPPSWQALAGHLLTSVPGADPRRTA